MHLVLVGLIVERGNVSGLRLLLEDVAGADPRLQFPVLAAGVRALATVEARLLN